MNLLCADSVFWFTLPFSHLGAACERELPEPEPELDAEPEAEAEPSSGTTTTLLSLCRPVPAAPFLASPGDDTSHLDASPLCFGGFLQSFLFKRFADLVSLSREDRSSWGGVGGLYLMGSGCRPAPSGRILQTPPTLGGV